MQVDGLLDAHSGFDDDTGACDDAAGPPHCVLVPGGLRGGHELQALRHGAVHLPGSNRPVPEGKMCGLCAYFIPFPRLCVVAVTCMLDPVMLSVTGCSFFCIHMNLSVCVCFHALTWRFHPRSPLFCVCLSPLSSLLPACVHPQSSSPCSTRTRTVSYRARTCVSSSRVWSAKASGQSRCACALCVCVYMCGCVRACLRACVILLVNAC